jgi:hypothetical protein
MICQSLFEKETEMESLKLKPFFNVRDNHWTVIIFKVFVVLLFLSGTAMMGTLFALGFTAVSPVWQTGAAQLFVATICCVGGSFIGIMLSTVLVSIAEC